MPEGPGDGWYVKHQGKKAEVLCSPEKRQGTQPYVVGRGERWVKWDTGSELRMGGGLGEKTAKRLRIYAYRWRRN